jgi:hypothetical protein
MNLVWLPRLFTTLVVFLPQLFLSLIFGLTDFTRLRDDLQPLMAFEHLNMSASVAHLLDDSMAQDH